MTTVLYIAGWGRSGTTILDRLLGQVEGFVSGGELHNIWQRGLRDGRACGCGTAVTECAQWRAVFDAGFGGVDAVDVDAVLRSQGAVHTRHVRRAGRAARRGTVESDFAYAKYLGKLYDGISAATNADVIIDSSKYPTDAIIASGLPGYEVYVVHLVRDPRAVAYSWQRFVAVGDKVAQGGMLRRVGFVRSTLVWQAYNSAIAGDVRRAVGPDHYKMLRYERFVSEPAEVLNELIEFVGAHPAGRPAFEGNEVDLAVTHTASGNPGRFRAGRTRIHLDDEWRQAMPLWRRVAIAALANPTMTRLARRN